MYSKEKKVYTIHFVGTDTGTIAISAHTKNEAKQQALEDLAYIFDSVKITLIKEDNIE